MHGACTFPIMLLHVVTVALLTNIAFVEFYQFYNASKPDPIQMILLKDESPLHRVFVYGTLKRGEPNHKIIQDTKNGYAKFLGLGRTTVSYPLIIATRYNIPFLLKQSGTGKLVIGEVYDVDSKMLTKLDELEEHPKFYERTEEDVLLAPEAKIKSGSKFEEVGSVTKAWIYFLPKFRSTLLNSPMYESYSNEGNHGLKYAENDIDSAQPEDLL